MQKRLLLLAGLVLWISSAVATADDKDLLKATGSAPPNIMIVFGNSETTEQPIEGASSAWDGDADSPASKMGTAKAVLKQFINQNHTNFNIGLSAFNHGSSASNVTLAPNKGAMGKSWLYSPIGTDARGFGTVDFPGETWQEPIGTVERWGPNGDGPCTNLTTPACTDRSPNHITLPSSGGVELDSNGVAHFFGNNPIAPWFICLDGKLCGDTDSKPDATQRIKVTLTAGSYGDAFNVTATGVDYSNYKIPGPPSRSVEVKKEYQVRTSKNWSRPGTQQTPHGNPDTVTVFYAPPSSLINPPAPSTRSDFFYTTKVGDVLTACVAGDPDCGNEVGFLRDNPNNPKDQPDFDVNVSCAGWEYQSQNSALAIISIPRDYNWGATCAPPQDSLPCLTRLFRPQAKLVRYNQATHVFASADYDNPGYTDTDGDVATDYADGCSKDLLGSVPAKLNVVGRQAIIQTLHQVQVPLKNLLTNIYQYFSDPKIDSFSNGSRRDDPNATCRKSAVILIYDSFNGCQGDVCDPQVIKTVEVPFKTLGSNGGVPVYVIGLGSSASATAAQGTCIAFNTGAILPDGTPGYFPVSDANGLFLALSEIASLLNESPQTFSAAAVSATQATGGQMAYLASFSPSSERSIWTGRLNGYKLDPTTGFIQVCGSLPQTPCADGLGEFTIKDPNDPHKGATIPFPSSASVLTNPSNPSLIWNAGQNLHDTPGTGATVSSAILTPGASLSQGTYSDVSNDTTTTVPTNFYPGRKIVFSLPQTLPQNFPNSTSTLPIPAANAVPENRYDMTFTTGASWWPVLKALLGPQTNPPLVRDPPLDDTDAASSPPTPANSDAAKTLRFIWGDRDAVTGTTDAVRKYFGQKLGDIFHSGPLLVGGPNDFAFFTANVQNYQTFFNAYRNRRRVLYVGANDGLLHAFDVGVVGRDNTTPNAYDLGTGAELFAFAPRAIMQIYKPLKDAVGPQTKTDEWTVDLSPSAADVFIDACHDVVAGSGACHSGPPDSAHRAWHTVLVSGMREGSPFEGASPANSQGSYFALDITQPDELVSGVESPGDKTATISKAPKCLNAPGDTPPGDATCARAWPTVLWEITDTGDQDASDPLSPGFQHPDMGETWSKPAMGRVRVCTGACGTSTATNEDHYVAIFGGGFDRERMNHRGNWLYMVDIETGMTLYKANSTCGGDPVISSCTPIYFGSIPSGPTAVDFDGDGYLDLIYVGDLKGQLWRIDLTNLRKLPQPGRFHNQLDLAAGSGAPFLFFHAGPVSLPTNTAFYPMYQRPDAINLGYNVGGRPALGLAFGTGDRDDIRATIDPASLTYPQRFYYVVDTANTTTTRESDLTDIATPTTGVCSGGPNAGTACTDSTACGTGGSCSAVTTSVSARGWMLELINGERVVGDTLTVGGIIRFPTFNPPPLNPPGTIPPCNNANKCGSLSSGVSRLYSVFYNTGNAYPVGSSDRGQTQTNATFITGVTGYIGGPGGASGLYWSGGVQNPTLGVGRKITVRSWKEKTSRP